MQITDQMIRAAVSKAVELGVLPRKSLPEDIATNSEIMAEILQAATDAGSNARNEGDSETEHEQ